MSGARRPRRRRRLRCLGVALAIACAPSIVAAEDDEPPKPGQPDNPFYVLDTKNLFGLIDGADVGEKGDRSLEFETTDRSAGRRASTIQSNRNSSSKTR